MDDMYIQATYLITYIHTYVHACTEFQDLSLGGSPVKVWSKLLATTEPTVRMNVKKS